ncbi:acetate/propionate family kinase [Lacunimicrobium album]
MQFLLLNAGSSSLKAVLMESESETTLATGHFDWTGDEVYYALSVLDAEPVKMKMSKVSLRDAVLRLFDDLRSISTPPICNLSRLSAVGHRIVHGGEFTSSVEISAEIRERISNLSRLAPLHDPPALEILAAAEQAFGALPQIAIFDTAFHSTIPVHASTYAIPEQWRNEWGIRRYGFHGLSHAYCCGRAREMLTQSGRSWSKLVICHLGHGGSAAAVLNGQSVDTTMGFTPMEGLVMGTRSGSIDPGILLHLLTTHHLTADEVNHALNYQSGVLGLSGISSDMRKVIEAAVTNDSRAKLAIDVYVHRVRQTIGAFYAVLNGLDAIVFTAGVGENSALIRQRVCDGLDAMGISLDAERNRHCQPDMDIADSTSNTRVLVIATREDVTMCREVAMVLQG